MRPVNSKNSISLFLRRLRGRRALGKEPPHKLLLPRPINLLLGKMKPEYVLFNRRPRPHNMLQLALEILELDAHLQPRHVGRPLLVDVGPHVLDPVRHLVHLGIVLPDGLRAGVVVAGRGRASVADGDAEHLAEREELKVVGVAAVDDELVGVVEPVDDGAHAEGVLERREGAARVVEDEGEG